MFGDDVFCLFHMHIILLYLWAAPSGTQAEKNVQLFLYSHCKYVNNTINCSCGPIFSPFLPMLLPCRIKRRFFYIVIIQIKMIKKQDYSKVKRKNRSRLCFLKSLLVNIIQQHFTGTVLSHLFCLS